MPSSEKSSVSFTPKLPYILSALVQWIQDNGCTPMLVASVEVAGVRVPAGYAQNGLITLNISDQAVQGLSIDQDMVRFSARFAGRHFDVRLPLESMRALFAREDPQTSAVSLADAAAEIAMNRADGARDGLREPEHPPKTPKLRLVE